ncbi:MAG: DnaK suppressor protein, partial [Solirubrobacteraceae bacterium]|nr:DnaK suppressor protein [Solirubrobacteraceae bacterium]
MTAPAEGLDLDAIRAELEARRRETSERVATLAKRPERGTAQGFGKRIGDGTTEAIKRLIDIGVGSSTEHALARIDRALD